MILEFKKVSESAQSPQRVHNLEVFNLFSDERVKIAPFQTIEVRTGIAFKTCLGEIITVFPNRPWLFSPSFIVQHDDEIVLSFVNLRNARFWGEFLSVDQRMQSKVSLLGFDDTVEIKKGDVVAQVTLAANPQVFLEEGKF